MVTVRAAATVAITVSMVAITKICSRFIYFSLTFTRVHRDSQIRFFILCTLVVNLHFLAAILLVHYGLHGDKVIGLPVVLFQETQFLGETIVVTLFPFDKMIEKGFYFSFVGLFRALPIKVYRIKLKLHTDA